MQRSRTAKTTRTYRRTVLDAALAVTSPEPKPIAGVLIGTVVRFDAEGSPVVDLPYEWFTAHLSARTTIPLDGSAVGRQVAVMFEGGRPTHPVVVGIIQTTEGASGSRNVKLDGDRLTLTAEHEVVLRCGKASITLTRDGKILLRGAHLVSRSSGVNRIRGGSIHLN